MARIRSLKPEHLSHRKVGKLSDREYRLWVGMILQADDVGRLVADADQLRMLIFGYHRTVTVAHIEAGLRTLERLGLIVLYEVGRVRYAWFPSWRDHQRIDRPKESILPPPPIDAQHRRGIVEESSRDRRSVGEGSTMTRADLDLDLDRKGSDGKGGESEGRETSLELAGDSPVPPAAAPNAASLSLNGPPPGVVFAIPASVQQALAGAKILGAVPKLRSPAWWQAELRANPDVDLAREVLRAEAYLHGQPRGKYRDHVRFLHGWFRRADRGEES
jgi:hypothetical protein